MKKIIFTLILVITTLFQIEAQTLTYCEGEKVELTSQNTADAYEWRKVGSATVLGTGKDYLISNNIVAAADGDQYTLTIIKNNCTSNVATITLKINAKPTFTSVVAGADICETGKATYTITGTAGAVVTYKIGSETQTTATIGTSGTVTVSSINNVTANTTITVSNITKNSCSVNITASNTVTVTVNTKPTAIIKKKI